MSKILIYHHNDNDGYLAGSIAGLRLENQHAEIRYKVGSYDGTEDEDALKWADLIYVLDYTLPIGLMDKYFNKITWIDHHKTAIEAMEKVEENRGPFPGLRVIGKSGSLLTWEFFGRGPVPRVVALVNDRDVWKWELGEDTAIFHEASRTFMRDYNRWQQLLLDDDLTDYCLLKGKPVLSFIRHVVNELISSYAWEGMFEGHHVVFLNGSSSLSGEIHKQLREANPDKEIAIMFMVRPDRVTVGMYRQDSISKLDLGKIALKYSGGGHPGAAGFQVSHEEWIKIIKESKYGSGYRKQENGGVCSLS